MTRLFLILVLLCAISVSAQKPMPADKNATKETVNLYQNLFELKKEGLMFGHQDDLAYGEGWYGEEGRSDVKDVCGDYPAVYGWEIGHLELGDEYSLDSVYFKDIQKWIKTVYERGGINTISWHLAKSVHRRIVVGCVIKKSSCFNFAGWRKTRICLFAGSMNWLTFLNGLETDEGTKIPILFRPFPRAHRKLVLVGKKFVFG